MGRRPPRRQELFTGSCSFPELLGHVLLLVWFCTQGRAWLSVVKWLVQGHRTNQPLELQPPSALHFPTWHLDLMALSPSTVSQVGDPQRVL